MVMESVPESAIQLAVIFRTPEPTFLMWFSIFSSLVAAGAIMAETNIGFKRGAMNKQKRGPGSYPLYGLLPSKPVKLAFFQIGTLLFHIGYVTSGVLALVASSPSWR